MFDLLIQFVVTFGPLVLTVMGAALSISPPEKHSRAHYRWLIAFILVGGVVSVANFIELRSSDSFQGVMAGWFNKLDQDLRGIEPRHLTSDQKITLKDALSVPNAQLYQVQMEYDAGCSDCKVMAREIGDQFHGARWQVGWALEAIGPVASDNDVEIYTPFRAGAYLPDAWLIIKALTAAHISFKIHNTWMNDGRPDPQWNVPGSGTEISVLAKASQ